MRTIDKIITNVGGQYGAPMGRGKIGDRKQAKASGKRIYDCAVPMDAQGCYDRGGAYWGIGKQLRVSYTKDLSYVEFYRASNNCYPE